MGSQSSDLDALAGLSITMDDTPVLQDVIHQWYLSSYEADNHNNPSWNVAPPPTPASPDGAFPTTEYQIKCIFENDKNPLNYFQVKEKFNLLYGQPLAIGTGSRDDIESFLDSMPFLNYSTDINGIKLYTALPTPTEFSKNEDAKLKEDLLDARSESGYSATASSYANSSWGEVTEYEFEISCTGLDVDTTVEMP